MKHRVAVLGATGYSGRELIQLILRHPHLELVAAACRQVGEQKTLDQLMPGSPAQPLTALDDFQPEKADTVFLCLPHGASAEWAGRIPGRVIDLSADFRLKDPHLYQATYGLEHPHPEKLKTAVYGLTEVYRRQLKDAPLIANPGCYPTSILLALAPLDGPGLIIADSKSGVSGAGRAAAVANLYGEVAENVRPYQVGDKHRHRAEILQERPHNQLVFTPHVVPCFRGMLSSVYVDLPAGDVIKQYRDFYEGEPFVKIHTEPVTMAHTRHSNRCALSLHPLPQEGKLLILSSIDNLVKGAAGQALQNLNVAQGWPETCGF